MRIAVAVPSPHGERLSTEAIRHGHEVVLTSTGDEDLLAAFDSVRPELAIVMSTTVALTSALVSHCDSRGIRLLAVTSSDSDRRHAAEIGIVELVALEAPWPDFEQGLLTRLREPGFQISPPPGAGGGAGGGGGSSGSGGGGGGASAGSEVGAEVGVDSSPPTRLGTTTAKLPRQHRGAVSSVSSVSSVGSAGRVVAVWGAAGAPGRTTLAISVAAELSSRGYSVALCDADPYSASIAPTLGILDEAPGFAAACRLAGSDSLTQGELERVGSRYGSAATGFWVLTGISTPSRWPELSARRVEVTLAECKRWVDFTVVDTGFSLEGDEEISSDLVAPRRNAATIASVGVADHVLAIGAADPVGLSRFLRGYSDLIELAGTERVTVVMNKLRASAIGLNPVGQVQQTLARFGGIRDAAFIPCDYAAMDRSLLEGRTLREVAPKSALRLAISQLVAERVAPDVRGHGTAGDGLP